MLKGLAGFGSTHRIDSAKTLELSDRLAAKIEFFGTRETVEALLPEIEKRSGCGMSRFPRQRL
jgi:PII-like signaling protein